ncbi:cold shock domain-containing protein [Paracoccus aestuarii]|uniref:Cold shock domain-containing protein n=1 Tax=Paracoccus aestuarii TaxID=453842 RepID=A0A418ZT88_9RHOB|nr:cold shock domain-containing protein [Paracoccus aestuarii]RJL01432.1 cold shock domain-containing protein [Paracoccus aestuarii]WCR00737.1 cold shock domain-containing protein [Paracoccus aestuarii]
MTEDGGLTLVTGLVKWFDPAKGYGFILDDRGGPDILLHANVLRNFGRSSVADHSRVSVMVQRTSRGVQAAEVVSITPPETDGTPPIADLDLEVIAHLETLPLRPARVKWFDKSKGFGFANVFGHPEDVFIHIEVLRHSGFADLAIGEAVCLRLVEGPRGLMAAQIAAWDSGEPEDEAGQAERRTEILSHVAE